MYVIKKHPTGEIFQTGFYDPKGNFLTDEIFFDKKEAAARVNYLNGIINLEEVL